VVVQRFRWALFVILAAEAIEAHLLGRLIMLRGPGSFGFQGAVHAFVRPVLLWSPRFNALMAEAKLNPPHGELAQAAEGRGGERRAVVRRTAQ
jgi:hypothetical protein